MIEELDNVTVCMLFTLVLLVLVDAGGFVADAGVDAGAGVDSDTGAGTSPAAVAIVSVVVLLCLCCLEEKKQGKKE